MERPATAINPNRRNHKELIQAYSMKELQQEQLDTTQDSEGVTPGPGYYLDSDLTSTFQQKVVPTRYQYFGSTTERFIEKRDEDLDPLGPGCYTQETSMITRAQSATSRKSNRKRSAKPPFASSNARFNTVQEPKVEVPGPGAYPNPINLDQQLQKKKRPWSSRISAFGSTERRFVPINKDAPTPGPGAYKNKRPMSQWQKRA